MKIMPNEDWTVHVVGMLHKYRIRTSELAEKCINAKYLEDTQLKYAYEYLEEIRSAQAA